MGSRITIGRYARALADTGSGQHHEPRVLKNKVPEQPHAGLQRHTYSSEWQVGEPKTAHKASASLCPAMADNFSLSRTGIPSSIGMSSNLVIAIMPGNTSKTESKQTRTNLKKLGCLFEAFLGALFLDFNKISIEDEGNWFKNVFVTGPGFQIAQIFVENIFEKHVDWMDLIQNDENYKNILQVMLQKAFQVTPVYKEVSEWDEEEGYHMGVYLCLGKKEHEFEPNSPFIKNVKDYKNNEMTALEILKTMWVHNDDKWDDGLVIFLSSSKHKIKKKAEQAACKFSIEKLS